jgi:cell division septation protein DedD
MVWIRKAADRGDPRAEFVLATAFFNGDGVEKDVPRAYALMSHASAQGLIAASTSLAEMENVVPESDRQQGMKFARELLRRDAERASTSARRSTGAQTAGSTNQGMPRRPAPQVANNSPAQAGATKSSASPTSKVTPAKPVLPPNKPAVVASATPPQRTVSGTKPANTSTLFTAQGRWRVQLGAYGSLDVAKGQWATLSKKIGLLAGLSPSYEPFGAFTRLRVNSLADRPAAEKLCAAAKAAGQACFPVAP